MMRKTVIRYLVLPLLLLAAISFRAAAVVPMALLTDSSPARCTAHGIETLKNALVQAGAAVNENQPDYPAAFTIRISDLSLDATLADSLKTQGAAVPTAPESFAIYSEGNAIYAAGADAVGAMYAAYEIAEQIEILGLDKLPARIPQGAHSPSMAIRAVNPFFHVDAVVNPKSWFFDEKYWATYLDELSRDRYNLLDIHAMYELISTFFPNCYLYFLHSDKFPGIGVNAETAARNLEMFKKIVAMAKDRGIRVSLMSYHAEWKLTSADTVKDPTDEDLAAYTAEMVEKIIAAVPDLWMVGFRIGESGRREDFFKDSYVKGIEASGRPINLFTRSWLAAPALVRSLAAAYPDRFFLEIKYNGEHLGLPYHAMTSNRKDTAPSYTWEDYTSQPRDYKIIWQIRGNGTHRLFRWGDPVFASRVMRSVQFGKGEGFTMEPMTSYYPPTDFFHKNHADFNYFTWDHQRNWFWYMAWGRQAYNPDTPESVWLNRFKQRFGSAAAKSVYDTVVSMSRIVPLIYSYRCIGPDHRNMAPEYETGGTLSDFANNTPLDFRNMRAIDEYARHRLYDDDMLDAKLGPFAAAVLLDGYAAAANTAAQQARAKLDPEKNKEFKDITAELECLTHLANYYSNKIRAAAFYQFFTETGALDDLDSARRHTALAHEAWDALSASGEKYYQPILDTLRMRRFSNKDTFTWRELQPSLAGDINQLDEAAASFNAAGEPALHHRPLWRAPAGKQLVLTVTAAQGATGAPALHYRPAGASAWKTVTMGTSDIARVFFAFIPETEAKGAIEYYFTLGDGEAAPRCPTGKPRKRASAKLEIADYMYNDAKDTAREIKRLEKMETRTTYTVAFTPEQDPPQITFDSVEKRDGGKSVHFRVRVTDKSVIRNVELYHKPLPTNFVWEKINMKPAGDGIFEADLRLDPQGLMYFINASDEYNNAAAAPNFLEETPYRWIDAWDPKAED